MSYLLNYFVLKWNQIRDGTNTSSPLLGRYCGRYSALTVSTSGEDVFLWFTTDSSVTDGGFNVTWEGGQYYMLLSQ